MVFSPYTLGYYYTCLWLSSLQTIIRKMHQFSKSHRRTDVELSFKQCTLNHLHVDTKWTGAQWERLDALLVERGVENLHFSWASFSEQSFENSANKWIRKMSVSDISLFLESQNLWVELNHLSWARIYYVYEYERDCVYL